MILNLASDEYAKTIKKYLEPPVQMITCRFGEWIDGKIKEKGVYVKMARGEMVRFMAQRQIQNVCDIKAFDRLGYTFSPELSDETHYIFLRNK